MNLPDANELLAMLDPIIKEDGTINVELAKELYEMFAPQYRPYLSQIPGLVGIVTDDIGQISEMLVDSIIEIADSRGIIEAKNKLLKRKTEQRFAVYNAYLSAGFSSDQAMSLLLTDITNAKVARANAFDSMQKPSRERRDTTRRAA